MWVLDIDSKHGGFDSLRELGPLPDTLRVMTGGGGIHYYFRSVPGLKNRVGRESGPLPGIDVRATGGYVSLPGGKHSSTGRYEAVNPGADVLDAPLSLVAAVTSRSTSGTDSAPLRDAATILDGIPEGSRDDTLFRWACRLRRQHETDADGGRAVVTALVLQAARNSGFPENEALAKVAQAFKQDHGAPPAGEPSSWQPVDLGPILRGEYKPPTPTLMRRSDGVCLLYPGKVHSFYGEPESGKSFAAQGVSAQVLMDGGRVLYLDYETDAATVVERLVMMGVAVDDIEAGFVYVEPDARPEDGLADLLDGQTYDLAVVDGVTEALVISGLKSIDNDDVTGWMRRVPRRIAEQTGAAVVTVDHVTKSKDGRGRSAIGAQAKLAALSGPAYIFEVDGPLGRGLRGVVQVRIGKDRPGGVRPYGVDWRKSDRTQAIATVVVDSIGAGTVFTIDPPTPSAPSYPQDNRTREHAAAVAEIVNEQPGIKTSDLKAKVKAATGVGNASDLTGILTDAANRGLVQIVDGQRGAKLYYPGDGVDVTGWVDGSSRSDD